MTDILQKSLKDLKHSEKGAAYPLMLLFLLACVIGAFSVDYREERAPAMLSIGMYFLGGFIWILRISTTEQLRIFWRVFITAFALRLLSCLILHYSADYGAFAEDDHMYHVISWRMAQKWHGEFNVDILSGYLRADYLQLSKIYYCYVVAAFYYVFGEVPLLPKIFNVFMGSMIVIYLGKFCWEVSGKTAAKWTLWLTAFSPSMILWSGLLLRDCLVTFFIIYVLYYSRLLINERNVMSFIKTLLGLTLLGALRGYMFILMSGCLGLSIFIRGRQHAVRNFFGGMILIFAALFIYQRFEFGKEYAGSASFESLNDHRRALATGNSAIHVDADISSPAKAIAYLPIGVVYFLFAPFPWMIRSSRQIYTMPEVLVWYFLFYYFIAGVRDAIRKNYGDYSVVLSVLATVTLTYSLVEGNLGTAYRHRFQVMGLYLMFTGIGLAKRFAVKEKSEVFVPAVRGVS